MPKPASLPRWADVGGEIVEPASGKKDTGWLDSEMPPHSYFNWWQNLVYLWTVYLDELTDEALTWTALHTFQKGIVVTQSTTNGTGVTATGNGTGKGGNFTGGATNGLGLVATGGGTNGGGGQFYGKGTGSGLFATAELNAYAIEATGTSDVTGTPVAYFEKSAGSGATVRVISGDDAAQAILAETVNTGTGSIAIKAIAKDSGHVAVRAEGHTSGSGSPVLGVAGHSSQSAIEGDGTSHNGNGVYGHTSGGKGVYGKNSSSSGQAGYFESTDAGGSGTTVVVTTVGSGAALAAESGEGLAGSFTNTSSTWAALTAQSNGSTPAIRALSLGTSVGLNLMPQVAPTTLNNGDIWVETGTNTLKVRINGVTKTVTLT